MLLRSGGVPLRSGPELFAGRRERPSGWVRESVTVAGRAVELRPVLPLDAAEVRRFLVRLSPHSRYQRFHAPTSRVTAAQVAGVIDVDHHERETIVAVSGRRIVGLAQYARAGGTLADLAVSVADEWQGLGLGGLLVERVARAAAEAGMDALEASILSDNRRALHLARRFPGPVEVRSAGQTTHVLLGLGRLRVA